MMKHSCRLVPIVVLPVLLAACGGDTPPPQPPAPTASAPPTATPPSTATAEAPPPPPKKSLAEMQQSAVKAMSESFAAGDGDRYANLFTDNASVKMFGSPDMTGRDEIKKWLVGFSSSFSKAKISDSRVFVKGDVIVTEWVSNATHSGELMGFKATEKPVGLQGASIMWFTPEGLIKEAHVFRNVSTVLSQAGISKEKGRSVPPLPTAAAPDFVVAKDTPEEKANVEIIEKMNKAWEAKKDADLLASFTDDAIWDDLSMPTASKGKKEIKKYVTTFFTAVPDGKLATMNAWGFGDWAVEEGTYAGTHKGPMFGMPPTNKSFTIHELTIAKIGADKKITSAVTYGNDLELIAQIDPKSLPKAPAAKPAAPAPAGSGSAAKPAAPPAPKK